MGSRCLQITLGKENMHTVDSSTFLKNSRDLFERPDKKDTHFEN